MSIISTAADLACLKIYDPIDPGVFNSVFRVNETTCGTTLIDGVFYIVCQGTENLEGWRSDFDALPVQHVTLGMLHGGFDKNLPDLVNQLLPTIPPNAKVIVTGHSKGAGEGAILAGRLKLAGANVDLAVLFACPNAGYSTLADWLKENIAGVSFRNCPHLATFFGDPVPLIPISPYEPPYPHTAIKSPPDGLDRLVSIEWHRGEYYAKGITLLYP